MSSEYFSDLLCNFKFVLYVAKIDKKPHVIDLGFRAKRIWDFRRSTAQSRSKLR